MEEISEEELESIMGLLFDINGHNRMNNPHLDIIFKAGFEAGVKHVNNSVLGDVINCDKCGGEVLYDEEYKSTFCYRCYQG